MRGTTAALLLAVSACLDGSAGVAAEPTASELAALAPTVSSGGAGYGRLQVKWRTMMEGGAAGLAWFALHRAPEQFAIRVEGANDRRPLFFVSDNQLLAYDPVAGVVYYLPHARFHVGCRFADGALHFTWKLGLAAGNAEWPSAIQFDLASLFAQGGARNEITRRGSRGYTLTRTTDAGQTIEALVQPGQRCPFRCVAYTGRGLHEPNFVIDEICTGRDVSDEQTPFPSQDRLAKQLPLRELPMDAEGPDLAGLALIARAFVGRLAIADKEKRPEYERQFDVIVDWDQVELRDRKISRSISDLIGRGTQAGKKARREANWEAASFGERPSP